MVHFFFAQNGSIFLFPKNTCLQGKRTSPSSSSICVMHYKPAGGPERILLLHNGNNIDIYIVLLDYDDIYTTLAI